MTILTGLQSLFALLQDLKKQTNKEKTKSCLMWSNNPWIPDCTDRNENCGTAESGRIPFEMCADLHNGERSGLRFSKGSMSHTFSRCQCFFLSKAWARACPPWRPRQSGGGHLSKSHSLFYMSTRDVCDLSEMLQFLIFKRYIWQSVFSACVFWYTAAFRRCWCHYEFPFISDNTYFW